MAANPTSSKGPSPQENPHPPAVKIAQQAQIKICRLQHNTEKLRLETLHLRERLQSEHEAVRTLRAQHAAELRAERAAARRRNVELETQVNSLKNTNTPQHAAPPAVAVAPVYNNGCDQCCRLKAEFQSSLKQERLEFKQTEDSLKAQLRDQQRSTSNTSSSVAENCSQCTRLKAQFEAELKKELSEFRKKEDSLKSQLNKRHKSNDVTSSSNKCEQCCRIKSEFEAELRKEKAEFKKQEDLLKLQLEEKQKLLLEHSSLTSSLSSLNNCESCLKTKLEFNVELRKQQSEFRKKEEFLEAQLKEKQKLVEESLTTTCSTNCAQCVRFKAEFDAELRKQQSAFRKKEDLLKAQLKDKDLSFCPKNSWNSSVASCEQCARLKAEFEAVFRKEKGEFRKREALLKTQLTEMKKLVGGVVGHDGGGNSCLSCLKFNKEIGKLKESLKDFEDKLQVWLTDVVLVTYIVFVREKLPEKRT